MRANRGKRGRTNDKKGKIAIVPHRSIAPRLIILAQRFVRRDGSGRDLEWEVERKMRNAEPG